MRPYPTFSVILFALLVCPGCAETAIPVEFSGGAAHTAIPILMDGPPTFEDHEPLKGGDLATYRLSGEITALLSTRPPKDREAAERVMQETVRAHQRHVTRSAVATITQRIAQSGEEDSQWHTRLVTEESPEVSLDASGLEVRYGYVLEVRAQPAWIAALVGEGRTDPTLDVEIAPSWWGDAVSTATLAIEATQGSDAFLPYPKFASDGILDIAIHVGTHAALSGPTTARLLEVGQALLELGFEHPSVAILGALTVDGAPFVREAVLGAIPVEVQVTLIAEAAARRDGTPGISSSLRESLSERDVVILRDLHPQVRSSLVDSRTASLTVHEPKVDQAQLVILEGATLPIDPRTWIGAAAGPSSRDIVALAGTAVDLESAVEAILEGLTLMDASRRHIPVTVAGLLRLAEGASEGPLHAEIWGLADNPQTNPYGTAEVLCQPCTSPWACGAAGNLCVETEAGAEDSLGCGLGCAGAGSCPDGFRCAAVASDPSQLFLPSQCVPRSGACPHAG
jgi:hypothetical protein